MKALQILPWRVQPPAAAPEAPSGRTAAGPPQETVTIAQPPAAQQIVTPQTATAVAAMRGMVVRHEDDLRSRLRERVAAADLELVNKALDEGLIIARRRIEYEPMDTTSYVSLTFAALIVMIACGYMPQLTSLKLPGVQMDKSAGAIESVRTISISKDLGTLSGVGFK